MYSSNFFPTLRMSAATRIALETISSEAAMVMVILCTGVKTNCPSFNGIPSVSIATRIHVSLFFCGLPGCPRISIMSAN